MTVEVEEIAAPEAAEAAPAKADDTLESVARDLGWKSAEEWKGEPPAGGHLTAAAFLKAQKDKADSLSRDLKAFRKEADARIARIERQSEKTKRKEIDALHQEYDHWIKQAAKNGDDKQYDRLVKEKAELDVKADEDEGEEEASGFDPDDFAEKFEPSLPKLQKAFWQEHAWALADDADLDAMRIVNGLVNSGVPLPEALEKAGPALRKAYPEMYEAEEEPEEKPKRRTGPVLAPGGRSGGRSSLTARMTPAQHEIAARCVKEGLYASKEEWAEVRFRDEQ